MADEIAGKEKSEEISPQDAQDEAEYDKINDEKNSQGINVEGEAPIQGSPENYKTDYIEEVLPLSSLTGEEASFVVGVGASAGGLEALQSLFEDMPLDTNMAFVVVQHLSPDYKSLMSELLARKTALPIHVATDQIPLFANNIYLLPPKKEMIVANEKLLLTDRANSDTLNLPINTFLSSLAESYQDRAIAIILSGTGSDGSEGIDIIHDNGGMVLTQDPEESQFDGMPNSAIASGNVDLVIKVKDIPEALKNYARRTDTVRSQFNSGQDEGEEQRFAEILILLNTRFDIDFRHYKPSTITRRIERRLNIKACNLKDYTRLLMSNENELDALYRDLLIGVTKFFRDPAAFNSLRSEISFLIKNLKVNEELRIWSVACASGQEPYSIAMLVHDICQKENHNIEFKVFATDMHPSSIEFASRGIYQEKDMDGLSAELRQRYFRELTPDSWQICSEIRKHIVFAQHNILKDPPFTKMSLITCRNLLIYFDIAAQQRVISLLSFALLSFGRLFLGPSETLGRHERDFKVVDLINKIYEKKRGIKIRHNLDDVRDDKYNVPVFRTNRTTKASASVRALIKDSPVRPNPSIREQKALEALLQIYVPPSILIDGSGDVLHIFGEVGKLLSLNVGSPSLSLRNLVDEPARTVLGQMLHRVKKNHKPVKVVDVKGFVNQESICVEMRDLPGFSLDVQNFLVTLTDNTVSTELENFMAQSDSELFSHEQINISDMDVSRIRELEFELQETKESLQSAVEELETSNEELQATNEELMASNEELQSTNEELQSVNEELLTVNAEFKSKESQAAEAEADERSVIEKSGIGILFLDNQLRVRKFSNVAKELFSLKHEHLDLSFASLPSARVKSVLSNVNQVLNEGGLVEQEIMDKNGTVYHMLINRLDPLDNKSRSRGVIVTLTNISSLYATRERLSRSESSLQSILDNLTDGYIEWNVGEDTLYLSQATVETLGYSIDESLSWSDLLAEDTDSTLSALQQSLNTKQPFMSILPLRKANTGQIHWMLCKGHFISKTQNESENQEDSENQDESVRFYGHFIDMHDYKQLEQQLQEQMKELERSNGMLEEFAHIVSHDLKAPLRHSNYSLQFLKEALVKQDIEQVNIEVNELFTHMKTLKNLIDDVIRFSRVSAEKTHISPVSLEGVIESAIELNADVINEKGVVINCAAMPTVQGDKAMLVHLFQNLLSNACKYNTHDTPTIDISYKNIRNMCVIRVKDNGIGMLPEAAERIFKPFHRLVTKQEYEGSGIGLAICKILVEQHKGSISVESSLGNGSVFTVNLPLNIAQDKSTK